MTEPAQFLFTTCQPGAERALKAEIARLWPEFRAAFSRPGYVTFKLPHELPTDFRLNAVFARTYGISLGKVEPAAYAQPAIECDEIHIWQRGDEPSELVPWAAEQIATAHGWPAPQSSEPVVTTTLMKSTVDPGAKRIALDCAIVEPNEWWLGWHAVSDFVTACPGGWYAKAMPEHAVSRAYLKMDEALTWSQLPVQSGDHVAEIGCSPGGASQALLDRGCIVIGIDPADVEPIVLTNPHFTHVRKRGHEVKRRDFRHTKWLTADMNVAPQYTLDTVEAIVTHDDVQIRGLILTLKLLEWKLADEIPAYIERIHSWGFQNVRARQLSHNRREICVAVS